MVEIIGDIVMPSEFIVPTDVKTATSKTGLLFISGAKLYFDTGTAIEIITSA